MDPHIRVLAIDDAEFVQHIYRVCFRRVGNVVLQHAYNGLEGLKLLEREEPFDLIILDLNMPVMDGLVFLEEFKNQVRHRGTHVLVATTEDRDDLIHAAIARGASSYLKKPFSLEQFLQFFGQLLPRLLEERAAKGRAVAPSTTTVPTK